MSWCKDSQDMHNSCFQRTYSQWGIYTRKYAIISQNDKCCDGKALHWRVGSGKGFWNQDKGKEEKQVLLQREHHAQRSENMMLLKGWWREYQSHRLQRVREMKQTVRWTVSRLKQTFELLPHLEVVCYGLLFNRYIFLSGGWQLFDRETEVCRMEMH